jgi:biopolymer transport protein ExbB
VLLACVGLVAALLLQGGVAAGREPAEPTSDRRVGSPADSAADSQVPLAASTVDSSALHGSAAAAGPGAGATPGAPGAGGPAGTSFGRTPVGRWFVRGGGFMWPLLVFAVITLAVIVERAWTLARARTNTRRLVGGIITSLRNDGVTAATQVCERTRGPIAAILHSGLLRADRGPEAVEKAIETAGTIEMSFLERGLSLLAASASIAPLVGFLGVVSGLIHTFDAVAAAGEPSARVLAAGISEALITGLAGLMIAVPASIAHSLFLSAIDRFIIEMEESAAELVEELSQVSG